MYMYMNMYVCMFLDVCIIYIYMCACVCVYVYRHVYVHIYICICIYICIHIYYMNAAILGRLVEHLRYPPAVVCRLLGASGGVSNAVPSDRDAWPAICALIRAGEASRRAKWEREG